MYELTGDPRLVGLSQSMSRLRSPNFRVGASGVSGMTSGRAIAEGGDGSEVPTSLVAVTANRYSLLLLSPLRVQVVVLHSLLYFGPLTEVTV